MSKPIRKRPETAPLLMLDNESLYVGIDIGKHRHVAGFVSNTLIARHERFEACPVITFEQSREGFRSLVERMRAYVPLVQCYILLEQTGHYHRALVQYFQELGVTVYMMHVQKRPSYMVKTDKRDALSLANQLYNQQVNASNDSSRSTSVHFCLQHPSTGVFSPQESGGEYVVRRRRKEYANNSRTRKTFDDPLADSSGARSARRSLRTHLS